MNYNCTIFLPLQVGSNIKAEGPLVRKKMSNSEPRFIVAVDFGTTFSGFAFSETSQPEVYLYYTYPFSRHFFPPYCKTRSSVLYESQKKQNLKLESWGWEAENLYKDNLKSSSEKQFRLLSNFKLYLDSGKCKGKST